MAPRGDRETTLGDSARNLAGGQEKEERGRERHSVGTGGEREAGLGNWHAGTDMSSTQVGK